MGNQALFPVPTIVHNDMSDGAHIDGTMVERSRAWVLAQELQTMRQIWKQSLLSDVLVKP